MSLIPSNLQSPIIQSDSQDPYRTSRRVYTSPQDQLPYTTQDSPSNDIHDPDTYTDELKKEIRQHAYQRLQTIYIKAEALFGLGKRSNPLASSNLKTGVDHARAQINRGKENWDAAHSDAAAGFYDNRREEIKREIIAEKQVSPIKAAIINAKAGGKFSEAEVEELLSLTEDPEAFTKKFDELWKPTRFEFSSLLDDTYIGIASNITSLLPRDLNRKVDRGLEFKIRPLYAELLKSSMLGEKEPEDIVKTYQVAINKHFARAENCLGNRIIDLTQYKLLVDQLTGDQTDEQKALLNAINTIQKKLSRFLCAGVPSVFEPTIPNLFDETIDTSDHDAILALKTKFHNTVSEIKSNFSKTLNKMKCYLLFTQEEHKGNEQLPDFPMLSGTYIPEINKRLSLSPTKRLENRFENLRPCEVAIKRRQSYQNRKKLFDTDDDKCVEEAGNTSIMISS